MHKNRLLIGTSLFVLLCASLIACVKAEVSMWVQSYGGETGFEEAFSLIETSDGGYALAGCVLSFSGGDADFWLVKTDLNGNVEWNQTYGGEGEEMAKSLVETSDGGYAIAGFTDPFNTGVTDGWLVKTDEFGNMEWNKTYGGAGSDAFNSLVETSDGGYAIAGMWNCTSDHFWLDRLNFYNSGGEGWLVKTDADGNVDWNMTYVEASTGIGSAFSLVETSDNGFAFSGTTGSFESQSMMKFWLVKTDEFGNREWEKKYGDEGLSVAYSLVEASDGGYALAGRTGNGDCWLVKTDADGLMEWNHTYGGDDWNEAFSLVKTLDGGYAIAGIWDFVDSTLIGHEAHSGAFWLVKTDADGLMEWNHTYGGGVADWAYSLVATSDGGYALAGFTSSFGAGGGEFWRGDFWLVKTDENGVAPVVPEAAWVILPLLLAATLAIFISKKKLLRTHSKER